ncbi:hypothetical protein [Streptomyces sp. SAS_275]|uniref:hypothetical protein n=1 Tax=Streptomyces sp. SAS_275 TaxID=3412746 RepID=UPI00403CAE36
MTKIKVPLQFHQSSIESAVKNQRPCRSAQVSSISAVENAQPAPCAGKSVDAKKHALTALMELTPPLTCENDSSINGTATELPYRGPR